MDIIDKKISCILEENCRTPISQIARKLRINRNSVTYRINNLKKKGIIKKYLTSINLGKLGYNTYKIYFQIQNPHLELDLINYLKEKKEIIHLIKLEGEYNLSCVIVTKNVVELDLFLMEIKTKFEKVIKDLHVSIIVYSKVFKFEKLLLDKKNAHIKIDKYSSEEKEVKLDEIDKTILQALSQNADLSYTELMKKTGLTLDIIKYRMKKLKENIIESFRVLFDLNKFGYFHYRILLNTNQMTKGDEQKLLTWSTMKKNILYCTKRIGAYDFELNVAITDINDLKKFMNELQLEFSEKINNYSTILVSEVLKLNYVPF